MCAYVAIQTQMTVSAAVASENCKVIEELQIGQKLCVASDGTLSIDEPWLFQGVARFVTGNSRAVTLQAVDACATWAPASALSPMTVNGVRMLATTYTQAGDLEMAKKLCALAIKMTERAQGPSAVFLDATATATASASALALAPAFVSEPESKTEPKTESDATLTPTLTSSSLCAGELEPSVEPSQEQTETTACAADVLVAAPPAVKETMAVCELEREVEAKEYSDDEDEDEDEDENENACAQERAASDTADTLADTDAHLHEHEDEDMHAHEDVGSESDLSAHEAEALLPPSRTTSVQQSALTKNPWRRYTSSVVQKTPLCWQTMA